RGRRHHGLHRGRPDPVLGQLRRLRPLGGGDRALPRPGRPRVDGISGAGLGGAAPRLPSRGALAHGEHAEGAAQGAGERLRPPGLAAGAGSPAVTDLSSPNLGGVDRFAFDPQTVEKPWGSELIWALTDDYAGKTLFIRAGQSLSLQFHTVKDESWYVLEGRAKLELGEAGDPTLVEE